MTAPRVIPALTPNSGTPLTLFPNKRFKAAAVGSLLRRTHRNSQMHACHFREKRNKRRKSQYLVSALQAPRASITT
jgi:hypothetical protein